MSDIVEFLRARLDEDEQDARAAVAVSDRLWAIDDDAMGRPWVFDSDNGTPLLEGIMGAGDLEVMTHVVRWHPARVLREVEAKRRIVDLSWHHLGDNDYGWGMEEAKRQVLHILAATYSDHPDYRDEWR